VTGLVRTMQLLAIYNWKNSRSDTARLSNESFCNFGINCCYKKTLRWLVLSLKMLEIMFESLGKARRKLVVNRALIMISVVIKDL